MLYSAPPSLLIIAIGLIALVIGSFLNVVIYRLPLMYDETRDARSFNLAWPASFCPHCHTQLHIWHNIPLLSFLLLKGQCYFCKHAIHWRYPVIEALSLILSLALLFHMGWQVALLPALLLTYTLLALTAIDINEQILPDSMTLSLLWLGLITNTFDIFTSATDAIWGAVLGYTLLYAVDRLYYFIRKRSGIGLGDCKLLAALGAFFGVHALLPIILTASVLGLLVALIGIVLGKLKYHVPIAFGPYLALAAWGYLFVIF